MLSLLNFNPRPSLSPCTTSLCTLTPFPKVSPFTVNGYKIVLQTIRFIYYHFYIWNLNIEDHRVTTKLPGAEVVGFGGSGLSVAGLLVGGFSVPWTKKRDRSYSIHSDTN